MYSNSQLRPAQKRTPLRTRIAGVAIGASVTLIGGVALSAPAQASDSVWDAVAACESTGNWAISSGNGFSGGLQFTTSTWNAYGGTRYASSANRASKSAQIATAKRVLAAQGPGAWPVCSGKAGLTRGNGGAASAVPARAHNVSRSMTRTAIPRSTSRSTSTASHSRWTSSASHSRWTKTASHSRWTKTASHSRWTSAASHSWATGKLGVDGITGPMTTRAIQRWVGTSADGVFGPRSKKALQRKVGATQDGVVGRKTVRALQTMIGARHDGAGHLSASTVMKLQAHLSSN